MGKFSGKLILVKLKPGPTDPALKLNLKGKDLPQHCTQKNAI